MTLFVKVKAFFKLFFFLLFARLLLVLYRFYALCMSYICVCKVLYKRGFGEMPSAIEFDTCVCVGVDVWVLMCVCVVRAKGRGFAFHLVCGGACRCCGEAEKMHCCCWLLL